MQKVISGFFFVVFVVMMSIVGLATQARADFNQGSGYSFEGNQAWGWATANNAVVTSISSSTSYEVNQETGETHIYTNTFFSGMFVDPILVNPTNNNWCQYLAEEGLHNSKYFELGTMYYTLYLFSSTTTTKIKTCNHVLCVVFKKIPIPRHAYPKLLILFSTENFSIFFYHFTSYPPVLP